MKSGKKTVKAVPAKSAAPSKAPYGGMGKNCSGKKA